MLEGRHLHVSYGRVKALKGVDYSIQRGSLNVLIGPSGSGKSTLHRVLALLERPEQGSVRLDGREYRYRASGQDGNGFWPRVSLVFQGLYLWPHLTLRQNICLPLRHWREAERDRALEDCVDLFQMASFLDRYPNEASGGERQRAALARALVLNPEYLLLDEITSALDVEQSATINNLLLSLKDRGIGMSVITHSLNFAENYGDKIWLMAGGEIVEAGDRTVFRNPQTALMSRLARQRALD